MNNAAGATKVNVSRVIEGRERITGGHWKSSGRRRGGDGGAAPAYAVGELGLPHLRPIMRTLCASINDWSPRSSS